MKIRLKIDPRYIHRFHAMLGVRDLLADSGIAFVEDGAPHDVLFIQESVWRKEMMAQVPPDQPVIVYERIGCGNVAVYKSVRRLMQRPQVVAWAKETDFRDHAMNNLPMVFERYHLSTINTMPDVYPLKPQETILPEAAFAKIRRIFPIYMQERYDYLKKELRPRHIRKRRIDVFYAGTMNYECKLVDAHRRNVVGVINGTPWDALTGSGNVFDQPTFQRTLIDARIFVSPYGSGVYSWKDFEAIIGGCVLIKPKADYITTYGFDIYRPGKYCIECRPDFADLPQIIERVMDDIETWAAFAAQAREAILAACDRETYASDLVTFFREVEAKAGAMRAAA